MFDTHNTQPKLVTYGTMANINKFTKLSHNLSDKNIKTENL